MTAQQNPVSPAPAQSHDAKRNRLGRGLAALIGDAVDEDSAVSAPAPTNTLPIESIRANAKNPRRSFREEDLTELAQSIVEKGLLQPLVVRPLRAAPGSYEIVAGERRWRAAQMARLDRVPVVVKELSDAEALEIAIIENVQRADLNPVEEAAGYRRLLDEFGYTQEQLSKVLGKSRSHVANTLRLMNLPDKVKQYLGDGLISAGHARALLTANHPERLATEVVQKGLSVRQTEALAKRSDESRDSAGTGAARPRTEKDANTRALERDLADALGLKVAVNHRGDVGGDVRIAYRTLDQLDEICRRLTNRVGAILPSGEFSD